MSDHYIVIDKVVTVSVHDIWIASFIKYAPPKKRWFRSDRKEGYLTRCIINGWEYSEGINEGYILKDEVIYNKPEVTIRMISGEKIVRKFDTFENAQTFANKILNAVGRSLGGFKKV